MAWKVKQGNTSIQDILVKDEDGVALTNLSTATEIKFVVKTSPSASANVIEKTEGSGLESDTPSTGYVRITLSPTDTEIDVGGYVMALQIKWGASTVYEVTLKQRAAEVSTFVIAPDIV